MNYQLSAKRSLRVCIVSPLFHPNLGGSARQAYTMASRLSQKGLKIAVVTRGLDVETPAPDGVLVSGVCDLMPKRHTLSDFTLMNLLISLFFSAGTAVKLIANRKEYDLVHFYGASLPLLICLPLLKVLKKTVVAKISGAKPGMEVGSIDRSLLKPFFKKVFFMTDMFIVMSKELRQRVLSEGFSERNVIRIPNGIDADVFYPADTNERAESRGKFGFSGKDVFLYSGRLVDGKGLEQLLRAFSRVVNDNKNAVLVLLGKGKIEPVLKKTAEELGMGRFVRFEGLVENIPDYLNAADVFVFPSMSEGMPNALLEAMACGLPCIASRIGGVVDIVEDGKSGILFEPGDTEGLAFSMDRLLKDKKLRQGLGAEARKKIMESFSIDRIADEYIKLYEGLLTENYG